MRTNFIKASKFTVTVRKSQLMKDIVTSKSLNMPQRVKEYIEPKVRRKQEHLIQEFTEHPVTVEINSGPHATNSSGLLGGYGNLFSFLGFESSSDPTGPIYKILQRKLKVSAIRKGYQGSYVVSVEMPSKENCRR